MEKKPNYKYNKRITTRFGISLPPRKKKTYKQTITLRFIIEGTVPSKKNEWHAASNWAPMFKKLLKTEDKFKTKKELLEHINKELKVYIRGSQKYVSFRDKNVPLLTEQAKFWKERYSKYDVVFPISNATVSIYHFWKDEQRRDNTNKADTILDVLIEAGILLDDTWQCLNPIHSEAECYAGEINDHETCIDLTINL